LGGKEEKWGGAISFKTGCSSERRYNKRRGGGGKKSECTADSSVRAMLGSVVGGRGIRKKGRMKAYVVELGWPHKWIRQVEEQIRFKLRRGGEGVSRTSVTQRFFFIPGVKGKGGEGATSRNRGDELLGYNTLKREKKRKTRGGEKDSTMQQERITLVSEGKKKRTKVKNAIQTNLRGRVGQGGLEQKKKKRTLALNFLLG